MCHDARSPPGLPSLLRQEAVRERPEKGDDGRFLGTRQTEVAELACVHVVGDLGSGPADLSPVRPAGRAISLGQDVARIVEAHDVLEALADAVVHVRLD